MSWILRKAFPPGVSSAAGLRKNPIERGIPITKQPIATFRAGVNPAGDCVAICVKAAKQLAAIVALIVLGVVQSSIG
jgi:hypothetical protein